VGFGEPRVALPGVLVVEGPRVREAVGERGRGGEGETERRSDGETERGQERLAVPPSLRPSVAPSDSEIARFCAGVNASFPLIVVCDDSDFAARNLNNFLWVTFTRANPAADLHGVGAFSEQKHWGCTGPLVIDARIKPHHAPPLESDPEVTKRVDALAARGGPLARWL
jgi:4-hydroxy-3-polyprenylbenzoate decarboxylase